MPVAPGAQWRGPVPGKVTGGMGRVVGVVFHIMGASMAAADSWFHNPASQVSAHFGIGQDGTLVQWVDTSDRAWHAGAANPHWIGVETEGSGGALSEAGCQTFGRLYRWLATLEGIPYRLTDDPVSGAGLGWHGMGGDAWGGHPYCPGEPRKIQRQHVLDIAQGAGPGPTPPEDHTVAGMDIKYVRHPNHPEVFAYLASSRAWVQSPGQAEWQHMNLAATELHGSDWSGWGIPIVGLPAIRANGASVDWPVTGVP